MNKVVITGMGAVTAIGLNTEDFWNALINGEGGIAKITRIPVENHDTTVAAQVSDDFEALASKYWKKRQLSATTKSSRMGLIAAGEAVDDCGADMSALNGSRIAVIFGIADNSYDDAETEIKPNIILKRMPSEVPAMLAMKYGITGATFNVSTACASSLIHCIA